VESRILADPPLVGREAELEKLGYFFEQAKGGKGTTIFISGEAGAGKTRLVKEFLKTLGKEDVSVLSGWCLSNAAVPYFPFFEAFNRYFASEDAEKLEIRDWRIGAVRSEALAGSQAVTPQVWKDQTFTAVANALDSISAKRPVVLFIDDLHWADSASLALVHYLASSVISEKALVLGTFRSEQLVADAEGRPHPLVETLRLLRRQNLVREMFIRSLDQKSVSTLAQNMLGGCVEQELAQRLSTESQGNPLFVVESLRMLNERNSLVFEEDQWRLTAGAIGIPPKIRDIILQRLSVLTRSQRSVLDAASVIGEMFDASLLASVLNQDSVETIKLLDATSKDTSLVVCEGELYRFDHARTRDALYSDLSPAFRKVYHAKVAEKLESTGVDGKLPLSDLAYQYAQAGNRCKAVEYALAAGKDALAKWSNGEAVKHFSFVVKTIGEDVEQVQDKLVALEGLGDAYYAGDSLQQAVAVFEQLANVQSGAAKLRAIRKAAEASIYLGDIARQKELTLKAEAAVKETGDRLEAARILNLRVFLIQSPSDWIVARINGEKILRVFEEEYALSDAAQVLRWIAYGQAMLGGLEKGVEFALRSIALLDELGDFRSQLEAYAYAGGTMQAGALVEEANRMFAKAVEVNEKYKIWDYVRLFPAYVWEAMGLVGSDTPRAIAKALKALEYFEKTDSRLYAGAVYGILVVAHALAEDVDHVDEYFGKLMSLPKDILSNAPTQIYIAPTMGTYYAAKNEFEKSNKIFTDWLAAINSVFPSPFYEASSKQLYAWSLSRQGRMEEAKVQLTEAQEIVGAAQERFRHVNVHESLMALTHPEVNQAFEIRVDLVNVSINEGSIVKVDNLAVPELKIVDLSSNCFLEGGCVEFKDGAIRPFGVKTVKLTVKAAKPETFILEPIVTYIDELGETKKGSTRSLTIAVQPIQRKTQVAGRVSTGLDPLDDMLLGGIPEKYAVALSSPSIEKRELLVKRLLEVGAMRGETVFYITAEAANVKAMAERYPLNFFLFVCNLQADSMIQSAQNVFKLKGVENLTEIDIALAKAFRTLEPSAECTRRICIDIVSDVLLQHHALNTRKWLRALLPTLKSQGFTVLAVIDPGMHPPEETQAVLSLFDGEISIYEKETSKGKGSFLRIRKMMDQKYVKDELSLTEE
jgi:KaiC/GvpD/RAD55 family RecA-like ATPase/tetratricopeptide (TPR) repeat protein